MLREEVVWTLLFLSGVAGVRLTIRQTPPWVTVTEGGSVQLNCSFRWNLTEEEKRPVYTIDWYKDGESALLCNKSAAYNGRILKCYTEGFPWEWASITILDLQLNDTGKYYCRIQIFRAEHVYGTGTEITVKRHEDSIQKNVYLPVFFALPAVVLTLVLAVVIFILRRCRSLGVTGVRLTIRQTPPWVTVTEGGSVQLNCSFRWNLTEEEKRPVYTIDWYKDEESALLCNKSAAYNGRILKCYTEGFPWEWASITILDLQLNDTGKYYCRIQIFKADIAFGTGTEITVKGHEDSIQKNVYLPVFFSLPAVVLKFVLAVVIYILCRCRSLEVAGLRLTIRQTPPRVIVTEGVSVQLNCSFHWNLTQEEQKPPYTIDWYKDGESCLLCNRTTAYNGRLLKSYAEGFPWEWASITILELKLNESGKYYCRIQIFNVETTFGTGTEITVKRHEDSIQKNVYFPVFFALPAVVFTFVLAVVIYILRRGRSSDKRSGNQVGSREVVKSQAVLYTNPKSRKMESLHPPDRIDHKSVKPGIRHEEPGVADSGSLAENDEGGVVYSQLRFQDHREDPSKPVKTPGRKEEYVVYGAVHVRQL